MPNTKVMAQILLFVCILTTGNVLWKYGLLRLQGFPVPGKDWISSLKDLALCLPMWIGALFYVGGTLYWFTILSRNPLSYVYPMVSIGYILTSVMGMVLFHETISWNGWLGMGIVVCGFIVMSIK